MVDHGVMRKPQAERESSTLCGLSLPDAGYGLQGRPLGAGSRPHITAEQARRTRFRTPVVLMMEAWRPAASKLSGSSALDMRDPHHVKQVADCLLWTC